MEHIETGATGSGSGDVGAGMDGQLPENAGKIERLARETRGLIDDMKDWVDLKMQLVQLEMEERVEQKLNQALLGVILAVVAFLALVFGLTALALGLGGWLGHDAWGFLIVTVLLVLVALALRMMNPRLVKMHEEDTASKEAPHPATQSLTQTHP